MNNKQSIRFTLVAYFLLDVTIIMESIVEKNLRISNGVEIIVCMCIEVFVSSQKKSGKMKVLKIAQKPHKCPQCEQRFTDKKNIRRHEQLKHSATENPKRLQCFHCKKCYQNKGNHDAHFEKVHWTTGLLYVEPEEVYIEGT